MEVLGCLVKPGQGFARSVYNLDTLLGTPITQTLSSYPLGSLWDHPVLTNQCKSPVLSPTTAETSQPLLIPTVYLCPFLLEASC